MYQIVLMDANNTPVMGGFELPEDKSNNLFSFVSFTWGKYVPDCQHTYTDDNDAVCNECYEVRQMVETFAFVNYGIKLEDTDETHKNHRITIYKLGNEIPADPSDEAALKALDANAVTYWDASSIAKIRETQAGNYVALLKYNVGTAVVKVPLVITVTRDARVIVDRNNKLTILESEGGHNDYWLLAYYLGEETIEDITDENALAAIDDQPTLVSGKNAINNYVLRKAGNYVLRLHFTDANGKPGVNTSQFSVHATPDITVDENNRVKALDLSEEFRHYRVTVYDIGWNTLDDNYDVALLQSIDPNAKTYWGLDEIQKIQLNKAGNYVLHLHYNIGTSAKYTVASFHSLNERPVLKVVRDQLNVSYRDDGTIHNLRAFFIGVGDNDLEGVDITDVNAVAEYGTTFSVEFWGKEAINAATMYWAGNHVIYLDYDEVTATGTVSKTIVMTHRVYDKPFMYTYGDQGDMVGVNPNGSEAKNYRVTVYYMDDWSVGDIYDESLLKTVAPNTKTYWGLDEIRKVQLEENGKYIIHLHYNIGTGPKQTIAIETSIHK